jgi:beta-glucuronidase
MADTGASVQRLSLDGTWKFIVDYSNTGEAEKAYSPRLSDSGWESVTVPHTWSHDPRFKGFIGVGWYRHRFVTPASSEGRCVRLAFGAVFSTATIWFNGERLGTHAGGYTPFEFDIGTRLKPGMTNLIAVAADNRWGPMTFPGVPVFNITGQQVYAWWDDGGLIRSVELVVTPLVYVTNQKIEALPDLNTGKAVVRVKAWLRNTSETAQTVKVACELACEGKRLDVAPVASSLELGAGASAKTEMTFELPAQQVRLWNLDAPVLYQAHTRIGADAAEPVNFGLRRFEARGEQLLLNGAPLRLAGANWHASHRNWGQTQPAEGVCRDLRLMKEGGFVFARLAHYAISPVMLDWMDRNGMLLIAEAGNQGGTTQTLASAEYQARFQGVYREMVERDWNHPCIVGWSVGNEFPSETPEGVAWVKKMVGFTRELDATRLATFVSNRAAKKNMKPEEEGSYYTDLVCLNVYGISPQANAELIDRAHGYFPGKPFLVTEYGCRVDRVSDESERIDWFREMLSVFRARPFISCASVWSFNDYTSRYPGTNPNGFREWGLVDAAHEPRLSYFALRRENSGFIVREVIFEQAKGVTVRLEPRADFPVFPPSACELKVMLMAGNNQAVVTYQEPVRVDTPMTFAIPPSMGVRNFRCEILRGGFCVGTFGSAAP